MISSLVWGGDFLGNLCGDGNVLYLERGVDYKVNPSVNNCIRFVHLNECKLAV